MFNSKSDKGEDRFRDPDDKSMEIIQTETQRKKDVRCTKEHWTHTENNKTSNVCVTGLSEGKGIKAELRISKTLKTSQIQKDLKTQSKINTKKTTTRHKVKNITNIQIQDSFSFLLLQTMEARKQ